MRIKLEDQHVDMIYSTPLTLIKKNAYTASDYTIVPITYGVNQDCVGHARVFDEGDRLKLRLFFFDKTLVGSVSESDDVYGILTAQIHINNDGNVLTAGRTLTQLGFEDIEINPEIIRGGRRTTSVYDSNGESYIKAMRDNSLK